MHLFVLLLVHFGNLQDLVLGAQVHSTAVVDVLGHHFQKTLCLRVDGQTASVLKQHRHRGTLV